MEKKYSDNQKKSFKTRLKNIIGRKFETAIIFPLSQFEEAFGFLWGRNKPESELTEQEKQNFEIWQEVRTSILDNGHKQKRNAWAEIDNHEVIWKRFEAKFFIVNGNRKD